MEFQSLTDCSSFGQNWSLYKPMQYAQSDLISKSLKFLRRETIYFWKKAVNILAEHDDVPI